MASMSEGQHAGEFIVSEANGHRSRATETIASGEVIKPGHVLGRVSSSGELKEYNPGNADGSETAVAVSYDHVDASGGAVSGAVTVARDAEINGAELVWFSGATDSQKATGQDELAKQSGIITR